MNKDWNAGYQAFVEGHDAFGCSDKSMNWNLGYAAAKDEQDLEVEAAMRECEADYDKGAGNA